jgi:hypothetical protein
MGEEITFQVNDTFRAIDKIIKDLRQFECTALDPRIKAIILTKLEEAQLVSLKLFKE